MPNLLLADASQMHLAESAVVGLANHVEIDPHHPLQDEVEAPCGEVGADYPGKSRSPGLSTVFVHTTPAINFKATEVGAHVEAGSLASAPAALSSVTLPYCICCRRSQWI